MHHVFSKYAPCKPGKVAARQNGVMIANGPGVSSGFAYGIYKNEADS